MTAAATPATDTAVPALPDALGDAAREFISKSHGLLIGDEHPDAADGSTFATLDPSPLVTHHMSLDDAPEAYALYDRREALKIVLKP